MTDETMTDDLVTAEGVNEGSTASATEAGRGAPCRPAPDDVLGGGRPSLAEEQDRERVRHDRSRVVVDTPWGPPRPDGAVARAERRGAAGRGVGPPIPASCRAGKAANVLSLIQSGHGHGSDPGL